MLDQLMQQMLDEGKSDLVPMLTEKLSVSDSQAGSFLESLLPQVLSMLRGDKLEIASLLSGSTSSLKQGLDLDALGGLLGGGKEHASTALDTIAGPLGKQLGGIDLSSLLGVADDGQEGGIDDIVRKGGGLLGKVLGE